MVSANYKVFVNWDGRDEFANDFEEGLAGWNPGGGMEPTLVRSTAQSFSGTRSMKITWPPYNPFTFDSVPRGFGAGRLGPDSASGSTLAASYAFKELHNLVVGRTYTISLQVFVPTSSYAVTFLHPGGDSDTSTVTNQWQELSISLTATQVNHTVRITPAVDPTNGGDVYVDYVQVVSTDDEITDRVLDTRTPIVIQYGRDQARSLTAIAPGEVQLEVDNQSRDYSPNNTGSPVYGYLAPGKEVNISAEFNGRGYRLFRGFLYDYDILPERTQRSVRFTANDLMVRMEAFKLSTRVYPSIQTGVAINVILDLMEWPEDKRDIDAGATTMRYWVEEGTSALEAIEKITQSEGLPAFAYLNQYGTFIFRDRHHRYLESRSLTSQVTLHAEDGATEEPQLSEPFDYDIGWRELFNSVDVTVEERQPQPRTVVWERQRDIVLSPGQTETIDMVFENPVMDALIPVAGVDYTTSVGNVDITLNRKSGMSISMDVRAIGGVNARITKIQLRARPIEVSRTYRFVLKDRTSIKKYGEQVYNEGMPWANRNDVQALENIIIGVRAERLPVIHATVNNDNTERFTEALTRELSDKVHIVETETFTDHDFYVEQIKHTITEGGHYHTTEFGYEQARTQPTGVFTFDDPARGFNDGVFGYDGISNPSNLMILGQTNLGEGFLGF